MITHRIARCSDRDGRYAILTSDYIEALLDFMQAHCAMIGNSEPLSWGRAYVGDVASGGDVRFVYGTDNNEIPDGISARFAVVPEWHPVFPTEAAIREASGEIDYCDSEGVRYQYRLFEASGERAIEELTTSHGRTWRRLEYLT